MDGLQKIMPGAELERWGNTWRIYMEEGSDVTMAQLEGIAMLFGTRKINIRHEEGEPHYSEWTPGSPGSVYIEVLP